MVDLGRPAQFLPLIGKPFGPYLYVKALKGQKIFLAQTLERSKKS